MSGAPRDASTGDGPTGAAACIFCAIVAGRAPASLVHADDRCVAFLDVRPLTPGHLLVVPRAHAARLADADPDDAAHLLRVARTLAAALPAGGVPCDGVNLVLNDGVAAGQEVHHVHLHVVPRTAGDGFGWRRPAGAGAPDRAALDATAARVRGALERAALVPGAMVR